MITKTFKNCILYEYFYFLVILEFDSSTNICLEYNMFSVMLTAEKTEMKWVPLHSSVLSTMKVG